MNEELEAVEKYVDMIIELADSSVNIGMRYWVPTKQYFQTSFKTNLAIYEAFNKMGITIPFPQRDIHMISEAQK